MLRLTKKNETFSQSLEIKPHRYVHKPYSNSRPNSASAALTHKVGGAARYEDVGVSLSPSLGREKMSQDSRQSSSKS